ncbi:uncharacterized protein LOC110931531 [Helianthus annuus]|uniref:uncharacterized protein LOC110931531 n=1 Tax=Helianthus annuus TaxID=4232 RepID=UPI000B9020B8|nr:uncharacterized protein LOC110931531 [Helianthus annuus]
MEPLFGFVSDVDMSCLKQQGITHSNINTINSVHQDNYSSGTLPNGTENRSIEPTVGAEGIPLSQRLLSAIIFEEGNDGLPFSGNNENKFNVYRSSFEFETDVEPNAVNHQSLYEAKESAIIFNAKHFRFGQPDLPCNGNEDISGEIRRLGEKHREQRRVEDVKDHS